MRLKKENTHPKKGLLTAQLGSVYDVPDRFLQGSNADLETQAGTTVYT